MFTKIGSRFLQNPSEPGSRLREKVAPGAKPLIFSLACMYKCWCQMYVHSHHMMSSIFCISFSLGSRCVRHACGCHIYMERKNGGSSETNSRFTTSFDLGSTKSDVDITRQRCDNLSYISSFFLIQDFGMSGLSCGAIYTWNTSMHRVLRTLGTFHRVTAFMQHALAKMLKDKG